MASNQQILTKAIQKAMQRSWDMYDHDKWSWEVIDKPLQTEAYHYYVRVWHGDLERFIDAAHILFDASFAKALWGEEQEYGMRHNHKNTFELGALKPGWQYHLQQMVIADDPIKYLGEYL